MTRKSIAALAITAMIMVGGVLAASWLGLLPLGDDIRVEGAVVTYRSEDVITVWCYRPGCSLTLRGHEGTVEILNCVEGSDVTGVEGTEQVEGTSVTFEASGGTTEVTITPPTRDSFTFAMMGDSQGHNEVLSAILPELEGCDFALLCGDLTPSGRASEFVPFQAALNCSPVPVYTTVGNHDVKTDGDGEYVSRFGPTEYSFSYGGVTFAVVDSSDLNITESQIGWMRQAFPDDEKKVIMTHVPCYDPFGGDHTLSPESCERMLEFAGTDDIDAVFTGHIHAFNHTAIGATDFIISGGAGATLTDGEHHYVNVTVGGSAGFVFEKRDVVVEMTPPPHVSVVGRDGTVQNLTFEELFAMPTLEGFSSFENYFGNIGGEGYYEGVVVSALIDMVGGMEEGDVLRVVASDGYDEEFGYLNVYPDGTWLELQGPMVLATTMDSVCVPDWVDGPKLVMLAPDGLYSNEDCETTSYDGQGYSEYPSAGGRWVKCVATIQVIPCT